MIYECEMVPGQSGMEGLHESMLLENKTVAEGFFQNHHKTVRSSVDDVTLKNFTNLEGDELRVAYLANIPQIKEFNQAQQTLEQDERPATVSGKKDSNKAKLLKDEGNAEVQKGNWVKALTLYSKSYTFMPVDDKTELAIIIANRSAALYHLTKYEEALSDIALALTYDYPKNLKFKVLDRRARCYLALKWNNEAIAAFKETISALDDAKISSEKRQKMQTDAQLMLEILNKSNQMLNPKNKPQQQLQKSASAKKNFELPQVSGKNNKIYVAASEALTIESTDAEGRFAQAVRDVTVGEIMVVEKAHCSVLLAENAHTHCYECFKRCVIPVACPTCSNVIFCSDLCQKAALSSHHLYECPILRIIWDSGCSITCHMALRIITQRPLSYFKGLRPNLSEPPSGKYTSNDYRCVYNLVRHENQRSKADFFQRTHMAVFLMEMLKKTNYFEANDDSADGTSLSIPKTNVQAYIGGLISRNLQILQFNAHEIFEVKCEKPKESGQIVRKDLGKSVFLGGGLYSTLALFNHSCEPGVVRFFQGTSVIVQAIKNIKQGQQISENYGPLFTRKTYEERKAELRDQYWFECHCTACQQKWPKFEDMDEGIMRFKCDSGTNCHNIIPVPVNCEEFLIKCGLCQQFTNILKGLKSLQDTEKLQKIGKNLMENGEYGKALVKFIEELKLYDETLSPPFKDYHLCQQNIRRCLLTFGNITIG